MQPFPRLDGTRPFSPNAWAVIAAIALAALLPGVLDRFAADPLRQDGMKVFGSYWASGLAWARGLDPYAAYAETWRFDLGGLRFVDLNLNPPILLPLFRVFAEFDLVTGARLWAVASALLAVATAAILLRGRAGIQKRQILWLFAAPALADTIELGQIYAILFLLATLAWLALKGERPGTAGALIGLLVLVKPVFCLWPVYLFVASHRRPAIVAGLTVAVLGAASVPVFGVEVYREWFAALGADRHGLIATDASLQGYFGRVGLPAFGTLAAALLVTLTLAWTWRRRFCVSDASGLALIVALLASPLAWVHYVLVLVPFLMERPWDRTTTVAALMLCVPVSIPLAVTNGSLWANAVFGGLYVGGLALILAAFVARQHAPAAPQPTWRSKAI